MARHIIFMVIVISLFSCSNPTNSSDTQHKDTTAASSITAADMPYKIRYGNWQMGDPKYTRIILDMFKAWGDSRLEDAARIFDTMTIYEGAFGDRIILRQVTVLDSLRSWRSTQGVIVTNLIAAVALHNVDDNEDWVCTWTHNIFTNRSGRRDTTLANENWIFRNDKVKRITTYEARPIKE